MLTVLRKLLDRLHPTFSEGGKLERLYPAYEAIDTFLYTPSDVTNTAAHVRDGMDLKRMMSIVVIALLPCFFMACHNTGYQANLAIAADAQPIETWREPVMSSLGLEHDPESFLSNFLYGFLFWMPIYLVTLAVGGTLEAIFSIVRGHEINEGFLVTSALFPLTLPPSTPLWQAGLGIAFGVVIGKEIFGGTGKNFLNPALTGRAFLYFAFPTYMSGVKRVPTPGTEELGVGVWTAADGVSGATPLGAMGTFKVQDATEGFLPSVQTLTDFSWWDCFVGYIPGSMGETSVIACLIGAAILIGMGIGSWKIMAGCFLGATAMSSLLVMFSSNPEYAITNLGPHWHWVIGSFAFGTVFMATDPVSASMTETGRWWYGGLVGVMTILIRSINPAFAEGVMLAILFGNVMAPLIDYFVIQANIKRRMARYAA
ncbi:NADH:ubiquinone reductase (Na(+)-transporting) subunit B [Adhaeretor mobilis]|uniref:Na(+)-translocating NADH-quinone reductase subunit B n=1 Tax=Adhaeretor mobilis TaxID=1930276 RepID=A0A517MVW1_9BACT|nr:NADH:ubiquinone reductase (Na(+)-transporting) subunit B [Adhaeretor mobilis]QDS99016.1 Na(+)-translocating NADH-quinone reductase subunit B [Adhaeretor mobilis]